MTLLKKETQKNYYLLATSAVGVSLYYFCYRDVLNYSRSPNHQNPFGFCCFVKVSAWNFWASFHPSGRYDLDDRMNPFSNAPLNAHAFSIVSHL